MTVDEVIADAYGQVHSAAAAWPPGQDFFWIIGEDWLKAIAAKQYPSRIAPLSHGLLAGLPYAVVEGAGKPRLLVVDHELPGPSKVDIVEAVLRDNVGGTRRDRAERIVEALT